LRLEITADAGQALADYLLIRPAGSGSRAVFISAWRRDAR